MIENPLKQVFSQTDHKDVYKTQSVQQTKISVQEYYKMAHSTQFETPRHADFDDLERKYWKQVKYVPPIYGCDVSDALSDPELEIWNIPKLDSVLKYVAEDLDTDISGKTFFDLTEIRVDFSSICCTFRIRFDYFNICR